MAWRVLFLSLLTVAVNDGQTVSVLRCLECHEVDSPDLCETWVNCGVAELCFTKEFHDRRGKLAYRLGCQDKQTCDIYSHADELIHILQGKRSSDETSPHKICRKCCSHDNCNSLLCTNSCPPGYNSYQDKCYYVSTTPSNWEDARDFCCVRGGKLVSINSKEEQRFLVPILEAGNDASKPDFYWTGGIFNMSLNAYQWMDGSLMNFTDWGPFQPEHHTDANHYKIEMTNPAQRVSYIGWTWSYTDHLDKGGVICEIPLLDIKF